MGNFTRNIQYQPWQSITYSIQGILIIITNMVVILFVLSRKRLKKQHVNIYLTSLLFSHILIGLEELLDSFARHFPRDHELREVDQYAYTVLSLCQCLNLSLITIDRLIAIKYPFIYLHITTKTVLHTVGITWLSVLLLAILLIIFKVNSSYVHLVFRISTAGVAIILLALSNVIIYGIAVRHIHEIKRTSIKYVNNEKHSITVTPTTSSTGSFTNRSADETKSVRSIRNMDSLLRSTLVCSVIVLSFALCYIPVLINNILILTKKRDFSTVGPFLYVLAYFNSLFDPVIYVAINKEIKKEIRKICNRIYVHS